jgi:hypothetical protein
MSDVDGISPATDGHVADAVRSLEPGVMVTRYLLVAETMDNDGHRQCVTITDDHSAPWDVYALARFALTRADGACWPNNE